MIDLVKLLIENYGSAALVITTLFGILVKSRRNIKYAIRSLITGHRFNVLFGDTPAETIKKLYESIQNSHDLLEVKQQIYERFLEIGVYICDLEGKCTFTNDYLNEIFGLDSRDMRGFGWLQAIHSEDRKRVHETWLYAIREGIAYNCEYTICNYREEKSFDVRTTAIAVTDEKDIKTFYVGYITLVSTRKLDCHFK